MANIINKRHYTNSKKDTAVFFDTGVNNLYNADGTKANIPTMQEIQDLLKGTMLKYNVKDDIYTKEFWQWCVNTPNVNNGALFSVEIQTDTPIQPLSKGFPKLKAGQIIYGFYNKISANSHVVIITDSGNYKITNGTALSCEKINAEKSVLINQPSTATNGTLTAEQLTTLQENDLNYIIFNNEIYSLMDKTHTSDTLTYSHVGYENAKHQVKTISITMSTRAWTLNKSEIGGGGGGGTQLYRHVLQTGLEHPFDILILTSIDKRQINSVDDFYADEIIEIHNAMDEQIILNREYGPDVSLYVIRSAEITYTLLEGNIIADDVTPL